jgi:DNA helicase-2/ATP-dependent DNA helicase PcrA
MVEISSKEKIRVLIHGKLDLAVFGEHAVDVFDFKTRKGMTQAEIKGETKNSDGNYFRQLVFYNLLLSEHPDAQGKTIRSSLVFLTPDEKGRIRSESLPVSMEDRGAIKEDIAALAESVFSGEILNQTCEDEKCKWCALRAISGTI